VELDRRHVSKDCEELVDRVVWAELRPDVESRRHRSLSHNARAWNISLSGTQPFAISLTSCPFLSRGQHARSFQRPGGRVLLASWEVLWPCGMRAPAGGVYQKLSGPGLARAKGMAADADDDAAWAVHGTVPLPDRQDCISSHVSQNDEMLLHALSSNGKDLQQQIAARRGRLDALPRDPLLYGAVAVGHRAGLSSVHEWATNGTVRGARREPHRRLTGTYESYKTSYIQNAPSTIPTAHQSKIMHGILSPARRVSRARSVPPERIKPG
jgi:hypothetical protein